MPIHPNISSWEATREAPMTVRMGFQNVRGIREERVAQMIAEREKKSFTSAEDFINRTNFGAGTLENLALANILECWRLDRRHTFWQTLEFHRLIKTDSSEKDQLSLFDERAAGTPVKNIFSRMSLVAEQFLDYSILGYSPHGNPMKGLREVLPGLPKLTSKMFKTLPHLRFVQYAGIMSVLQRPPPAKGVAFMTLEDEFGAVDVVFQKDVYERNRDIIRSSRFLIVLGHMQVKRVESAQRIFEVRTLSAESCKAFGHAADSKPVQPQQHPRSLGSLPFEHAFQFA